MQYVFTMNRVTKRLDDGGVILRDIRLSFYPGAKIGVLGLNGAGKSTLLKIMAGVDTQIEGEARPMPGIKVGYLPQEPQLDESKDVKANLMDGLKDIQALLDEFDQISQAFCDPELDEEAMNKLLTRQGELQNQIDAKGGWELDHKLAQAADALMLPPFDADIGTLSGGEKRRVALCRLLLSSPDMLLLDEPTNHLDADSVTWLEGFLERFSGTVVAVTHDRYFLDNVAQWILELDRGHGIPFEGNYTAWLDAKSTRLADEAKQEAAHRKAVQSELEWIRAGTRGRQRKNKARLERFDELNSKQFQHQQETNQIYIAPGERLGDSVICFDAVAKSYGDRTLYDNLSFTLPKGAILGVIGPNGVGKSTLLKLITGQLQPDNGKVIVGETVQLSYVDQTRDSLNSKHTVWQAISDEQEIVQLGNLSLPSRAYVSHFNFKGSQQQKRVENLSGGERNRLHLAKMLKTGGNVLLLDEPSNDLDVETLRALEEALLAFPGSAVVISHDRWFLDRVCTHILSFDDAEQPLFFEGNYSELLEDRRRRQGGDADSGARNRAHYRRLAD